MSELNSRQWALYNYLKERGDQWTFQEEIAYALKEWYCPVTNGDFHNTPQRHIMTRDIRAINDSSVIQKIIISNPRRGIKIANEEEWQTAVKNEYISLFKRLKRIKTKERKGLLDGQTRLVFKAERDVIEAFLHEG